MPLPDLYKTTTKTLKRTTKRHTDMTRYCAVFWVDSKIQRVWLGTVSEEEAKKRLEPEKAKRRFEILGPQEAIPGQPTRPTLREAQEAQLAERAKRLKPITIAGYQDQDKNALSRFGKEVLLCELTRAGVELWATERLRTVKAATVNRDLSRLRSVLRWAVREGWLSSSPMNQVRQLHEGDGEYDAAISVHQLETLEAACPLWLWQIVLFAVLTGFRLGEILGLEWSQVRGGLIHLEGDKTKGRRGATFPVSPEIQAVLDTQWDRRSAKEPRWVFTGERRRGRLNKSWVSKTWRSVRASVGLDKVKIHHLRHTFCTWLLERGVKLEVIQELARHRSFLTTKRYAKLKPDHQREALKSHPLAQKPTPQTDTLKPSPPVATGVTSS